MARGGVTAACAVEAVRLAADPFRVDRHVSSCLRCQVEAVRYRAVLRGLRSLRGELIPAPAGFLGLVGSGLSDRPPVSKKAPGLEAAVAAASLAAVAMALWRRRPSA